MLITLYHWRQLPVEIRTTFELPAWPYTENLEHYKLFKDYMQELLVFNYQDSELEDGDKNISYPIEILFNEEQVTYPFNAYMSSVHVSLSDLKVIENPGDRAAGRILLQKLAEHPVAKDGMAWPVWNARIEVEAITNGIVTRQIKYECLDPTLSCNNSCRSLDDEPRIING